MVAAVRVVAEEMAEAEKGEAAARVAAVRAGVAARTAAARAGQAPMVAAVRMVVEEMAEAEKGEAARAAVRVVAVPGVGNTHPCLQTQQRRTSDRRRRCPR